MQIAPAPLSTIIPRPPPILEGLPTELWTQICHVKTSYANGELFILRDSDLSSLRLTSRTLRDRTEDGYLQRHLACPKFSLTPWSLRTLLKLSDDARLRTYVKQLEFGPERLNMQLDEDFGYFRDRRDPPAAGCAHPDSIRDSGWPIWPVVEPPVSRHGMFRRLRMPLVVRWNSPHGHDIWAQKYGSTFRQLRDQQRGFFDHVEEVEIVTSAIKKLPNLRKINIDSRPVGPAFEELLGTCIRPSRGTISLGRKLGVHEIGLSPDPAPHGSTWLSKFNIDGLVFARNESEIDLLRSMFTALSGSDLNKVTLDLVITAVNPPLYGDLFDATSSMWKAIAPRLRSLTFDFSDSDLGSWSDTDFLRWVNDMLSLTNAVEVFHGRNLFFKNRDTPGLKYTLHVLKSTYHWTFLKVFHLFQCGERAEELLEFLLCHNLTLEEVSFSKVILRTHHGLSWEAVIMAMKGVPRLDRVTLDDLYTTRDRRPTDFASTLLTPNDRFSIWMKAARHVNVSHMLDVASQHMRLLPYSPNTWAFNHAVRFEIPEGSRSASWND